MKKETTENADKGGFTKNLFSGIGSVLAKAKGIIGKKEDDSLKHKTSDDKELLLLKLQRQKSLKPKIINDEFDKNYIRANSIMNEEEEEKRKSFTCPINQKIMEDPVITPYGTTYERKAILDWIEKHKTDYNSDKKLTEDMLVANHTLKAAIKNYNESLKL